MKENDTPLNQLIKLEKTAIDFGFKWPDANMIIEQAVSECQEIRDAIAHRESRERIQEEIGDLLHAAISMCIFMDFDVEETLSQINQKFGSRMKALKIIAQERGLKDLQGKSIEFMLELWKEAKHRE